MKKIVQKCMFMGLLMTISTSIFAGSYDWSGWYAGIQGGYGWAMNDIMDRQIGTGNSDWNTNYRLDGATGGFFEGYNFQNGNWVGGLELDVEMSNIDGKPTPPSWFDSVSSEITSQGSLRARLGYAFDKNLVYLTGGFALANIDTKYVDGGAKDSFSRTRKGWTAGIGMEYAFGQDWIGRFEYRYAEFEKFKDWTVNTDPNWTYHNDITEQAFRIGVYHKF